MVVTQRRLDWLRRDALETKLWAPLLEEFKNVRPDARVSLSTVEEDEVEQELKQRTSRGLGPDLILTRAPMANSLLAKGLIDPVPDTPSMRATLGEVAPRFLRRVRQGSRLSGLPLHEIVTLACFDRRKVPAAPRTTEQLMAMAAAGRAVGLSIDPYGIWWTAGTHGADRAIAPIITGTLPPPPTASNEAGVQAIANWLAWLRQMAQQSRVDIANGPQDLTEGLISSRLEWIPCFSLTLATLQSAMGNHLGVSALPSGPGGPPSPFDALQVWSFGLDSSHRQRESAAVLVQLSLDPLLQRRYVLDSQEVLPVNQTVQTPVASSGVLAALAEAQEQFQAGSPLLTSPFTVDHLKRVSHRIETVIQQVMLGVLTPREGALLLMRLGQQGQ